MTLSPPPPRTLSLGPCDRPVSTHPGRHLAVRGGPMPDPARAPRRAVRIRQIVSATIEMQIKDPRLGMVTITDARVTSDLREATVFYTVYGDAQRSEEHTSELQSRQYIVCRLMLEIKRRK